MGTGFTIDTPLKAARYGISSVISLVDDVLIEQIRKFYCTQEKLPYSEIRGNVRDARAMRITAYLNLVHELVQKQIRKLRQEPFKPGSDITRYFELLPDSPLKQEYQHMLQTSDPAEKARLQDALRTKAVPGNIDVNIMTKLNRSPNNDPDPLLGDALSAMRGFANSTLESSMVFSAGMNQHLYSYTAQLPDFLPRENQAPKKSIILKVSDYRSAEIQGKFLAKRGLWVDEYRIESGLNCGGHAFANKGFLMGPILEEFKKNKNELLEKLRSLYLKALAQRGISTHFVPTAQKITVQGGIGNFSEDQFLLKYYEVDGTGWGTPFLLVPEVTNVDEKHLIKLAEATEKDVYLSDSSPLNVPFWMLRTSESEAARLNRIETDKPGSPCNKGFLASSTEFTEHPICTASHAYQKQKLNQLSQTNAGTEQSTGTADTILLKACICHDLAGGATVKYNIDPLATTTVCCGPNIANFSKIATLEEMVGHIYGRLSLITNPARKQMFVQELLLYVDYFRKEIQKTSHELLADASGPLQEFKQNLLDGIEYYRSMAHHFPEEEKAAFLSQLAEAAQVLEQILRNIPCMLAQPRSVGAV